MLRKKEYLPLSETTINSIVGESTSFAGEFKSDGPLRIDGNFKGRIVSFGRVYIGKKGKAACTVFAKKIVIGGTIKGDIYAEENVIALKSAEIIGNIYTNSIKMEDGVFFDGECKVLPKEDMVELIKEKTFEKV